MDKTLAREMRFNKWAADLQDAEASGLGHREWCRMNNISYSTLKYRVRAVNMRINKRRRDSNVKVTSTQFSEEPAALQQEDIAPDKTDSSLISIGLCNAKITFPLCTTPGQFKAVLEAMIHA